MMMMEFSIFPVGSGESLSAAVARALGLVRESGLPHELTDMGTIVEGTPRECLRLVGKCIRLLSRDYGRLSCSVKIDYRRGTTRRLGRKSRKVRMLVRRIEGAGRARR
jgi:uncharacterized protein YqgV (UPF0045/DUF77 family)